MPVSNKMRDVEAEIDAELQSLPLWKRGCAPVLEDLMGVYRDSIELTFVKALDAELFEDADAFQTAIVHEDRLRNGALWALKWATEFCPESGPDGPISPKDLVDTIRLGSIYDVLVDALKYAEKDLVTLCVNRESKEIICYEGEDLTGFDAEIVEHQQAFGPAHVHVALTEDSDQLTSNWCAGDYRRVVRQLAEYASTQEKLIVIDPKFAASLKGHHGIAQPTLVWLDRPKHEPDADVFDSLTLPSQMSTQFMWRARSLLETPIVEVAGRFCALSSDLKAISLIDDYMLRLAARIDENQYSKVSGLREGDVPEAVGVEDLKG